MTRQHAMMQDEEPGEMPLALRIDLLVDGELSDGQRAALLRRLEMGGPEVSAQWRDLALRFLQGQVEKETVRQLMAGGTLVPADIAKTGRMKFPAIQWIGSTAVWATAAALVIAAISATMTLYLMREKNGPRDAPGSALGPDYFRANLPGAAAGYPENIPVTVPVMHSRPDAAAMLFPAQNPPAIGTDKIQWRSVVIQKDASGNAVVIPVNAMQVKVY